MTRSRHCVSAFDHASRSRPAIGEALGQHRRRGLERRLGAFLRLLGESVSGRGRRRAAARGERDERSDVDLGVAHHRCGPSTP